MKSYEGETGTASYSAVRPGRVLGREVLGVNVARRPLLRRMVLAITATTCLLAFLALKGIGNRRSGHAAASSNYQAHTVLSQVRIQ